METDDAQKSQNYPYQKPRKRNKDNPYKLREREREWPMVVESSDAMVG